MRFASHGLLWAQRTIGVADDLEVDELGRRSVENFERQRHRRVLSGLASEQFVGVSRRSLQALSRVEAIRVAI